MKNKYLWFLMVVLLIYPMSEIWTDEKTAGAYQIKAAFLSHFGKFIQWPDPAIESSESSFVIGVLGEDPFGKVLDATTEGRTIKGKRVEIQRFPTEDDLTQCHVLFVSSMDDSNWERILKKVSDKPVLTVGDTEDFVKHGGAIAFTVEKKRIRFVINHRACEKAQLVVSSKLYRMARTVYGRSTSANKTRRCD